MKEHWRLRLVLEGGSINELMCAEEIGQTAIDEWEIAMIDVVDQRKFIKIHGYCDTADQAPVSLTVKTESIIQMTLVKLY